LGADPDAVAAEVEVVDWTTGTVKEVFAVDVSEKGEAAARRLHLSAPRPAIGPPDNAGGGGDLLPIGTGGAAGEAEREGKEEVAVAVGNEEY